LFVCNSRTCSCQSSGWVVIRNQSSGIVEKISSDSFPLCPAAIPVKQEGEYTDITQGNIAWDSINETTNVLTNTSKWTLEDDFNDSDLTLLSAQLDARDKSLQTQSLPPAPPARHTVSDSQSTPNPITNISCVTADPTTAALPNKNTDSTQDNEVLLHPSDSSIHSSLTAKPLTPFEFQCWILREEIDTVRNISSRGIRNSNNNNNSSKTGSMHSNNHNNTKNNNRNISQSRHHGNNVTNKGNISDAHIAELLKNYAAEEEDTEV